MTEAADIFDYLEWRGDVSFEASPFNNVDGIILSRLAYIPLEIYFENNGGKFEKLKKVVDNLLDYPGIEEHLLEKPDKQLLLALSESRRFCEIKIGNFRNVFDVERQIQFAACIVKIKSNLNVVVYRGTDNTLIAWKENFNMGFICPLESQKLALDFFVKYAKRHVGEFILAGHSKGGNLAVYAGAYADESIQKRITAIYDYDGPGFMNTILESKEYKRIYKKICLYVPKDSIVGMILGHREPYTVIKTKKTNAVAEHDIYSWYVHVTDFVLESEVSRASNYFNETLKEWLFNMSVTEREHFVEAGYNLFKETNCRTVSELQSNWFSNTKSISRTLKNMDEETRKNLAYGISVLLKSAKPKTKEKSSSLMNDREEKLLLNEKDEIGKKQNVKRVKRRTVENALTDVTNVNIESDGKNDNEKSVKDMKSVAAVIINRIETTKDSIIKGNKEDTPSRENKDLVIKKKDDSKPNGGNRKNK